MADYSEFPTTPTAWQEAQAADWEGAAPLATEDPAPARGIDATALVAGLLFVALAVLVPARWFRSITRSLPSTSRRRSS